MLSAIRSFADYCGYSVSLLWGVTPGVACCRFEELFAAIPGIRVTNIGAHQLSDIARLARTRRHIELGNESFRVFRPGEQPGGNLFSWDLAAAGVLARLVSRRWNQLVARPSAAIRAQTDAYARAQGLASRLGIRVRVEENLSGRRKPHRLRRELDQVLKSVISIPWYARVFIATDSEYIQQMLASHFVHAVFLRKSFDSQEPTGRYVHRQDKEAMFTFMKEVECLCRCRRIINVGGFLNDASVEHKLIQEPYREAAYMHLTRR